MRRLVVATRENVDRHYGRVQNECGHGRRGEKEQREHLQPPETGVAKMAGLYRKEKLGFKGVQLIPWAGEFRVGAGVCQPE